MQRNHLKVSRTFMKLPHGKIARNKQILGTKRTIMTNKLIIIIIIGTFCTKLAVF